MFKNRSTKKELLDGDFILPIHLYRNLYELDVINKYLGGYKVTLGALNRVVSSNAEMVLVDIGSGGGDSLQQIRKWSIKQHINSKLIGIDIKESCIDYSISKQSKEINFICDDYRNIFKYISKVDVIHASLFCHHLNNKEIVELIQFCITNKILLIINDLERNIFAYYAIKLLSKLFSKSYLVKNDAPLSVLRGFKTSEWEDILKTSNSKRYDINRRWAFRHEIIVYGAE